MKARTIILLVVAVACGLGASVMTSRLLADRKTDENEEAKVKVLVAKAPVPGHTELKDVEKLFEVKEVPEQHAPKRPVSELDELKGQKLNHALSEGAMLVKDDILTKDQMTLVDKLKPGQVAVAIKVNPESLAGGFVKPDAKVVVLATVEINRRTETKTILQDMLVLAVGDTDVNDSDKKTVNGGTVTLAATQEEAAKLKLAQKLGELSLGLKGHGAAGTGKHVVVRIEDLDSGSGGSAKKPEETTKEGSTLTARATAVPELPPASPTRKVKKDDRERHRMLIINGSTVTARVMRLGNDPDEGGTTEQGSALNKDSFKVTPVKPTTPTYPGGSAAGGSSSGKR